MSKGDPNFQSTSRDVTRLLAELQSAGVEGIIIDLRNNGGGFLSEAITLTGLFIDQGPVVQVRDMENKVKVENDFNTGVIYDGPLAVVVNRFSASASEIFAAAIQDYQRGLILGEQTFGKGTVQTAMDLNKYFPGSEEQYGQLKYTIAKFYRVNGGSTQHLGVIPDIEFPEVFQPSEVGEGASPNALLWDEINLVQFNKMNPKLSTLIPRLEKEHAVRINQSPEFQDYLTQIHEMRGEREKKWVSLNEAERRREKDSAKVKEDDTDPEDVVLNESGRILADFVMLSGQ
jgi:carboxyl-terminal processing protease